MVADIEHRGFECSVILFQQFDSLGEKIIGVENGIVIGVTDFPGTAFVQ